MKRPFLSLATIVVAVALIPCNSPAQSRGMGQSGRGWGHGSPYERMYDTQTVETISGVVESISTFSPTTGSAKGVHLLLKSDREMISVHLGPSWFIDNLEPKLSPGIRVEIKGSRITFDGKPAIIAAEIRRDHEMLTLRNANGIPVWSGWKKQ